MALFYCSECGKEYSDNASACPNCGNPTPTFNQQNTMNIPTNNTYQNEKYVGHFSVGRLCIGILSIVLFVLVSFQSCAVFLGEELSESQSASGLAGIVCAICLLVSGIVGIVTRNSRNPSGAFAAMITCIIGGVISLLNYEDFPDLQFWGAGLLIFALVYYSCYSFTKRQNKLNQ